MKTIEAGKGCTDMTVVLSGTPSQVIQGPATEIQEWLARVQRARGQYISARMFAGASDLGIAIDLLAILNVTRHIGVWNGRGLEREEGPFPIGERGNYGRRVYMYLCAYTYLYVYVSLSLSLSAVAAEEDSSAQALHPNTSLQSCPGVLGAQNLARCFFASSAGNMINKALHTQAVSEIAAGVTSNLTHPRGWPSPHTWAEEQLSEARKERTDPKP